MTLIRDIDEKVIEKIAEERPDDAKKRMDVERDLKTMKEVLDVLKE